MFSGLVPILDETTYRVGCFVRKQLSRFLGELISDGECHN